MLYSNKPVYFNKTTIDRRINNESGGGNATSKANDAKDTDNDKRITTFGSQLKNEFVYRIPLRYFTDLGTDLDFSPEDRFQDKMPPINRHEKAVRIEKPVRCNRYNPKLS